MEADEDAPPPAPEIEKELEIRAPIEKVWDALTDAGSIDKWMHSGEVAVDLRPGGSYQFFGGDTSGVFTRVMRPHALEYTWRQAGWQADWPDSVVAWDLRPGEEDTTRVPRSGGRGYREPTDQKLSPVSGAMDLDLPRLDGLQATRRLKSEIPTMKVIILSTVEDETCRKAAVKYGADAFLPKSADIHQLLSVIRKGQ